MKALELKDFHQLVVVDLEEPMVGAGAVLIGVVATGICGSDIHGYTGENGRRVPGQVMGHETVGRIAALGAGADAYGLAVGQPVTFNPLISCNACEACDAGQQQHCPDRTVIGVNPSIVSAFAEQEPPRHLVRLCFAKRDETIDAGIAAMARAREMLG